MAAHLNSIGLSEIPNIGGKGVVSAKVTPDDCPLLNEVGDDRVHGGMPPPSRSVWRREGVGMPPLDLFCQGVLNHYD